MKVLLSKVRETLRKKRTRKILMRFVSVFSAAIVFITTYALILPAITLELKASCGIEEHQHSDKCYEERLICGQEENSGHHHDDSCYEVRTELDCEIEEHQHSVEDGCYDADGNLVCELTEHVHDDSCYRNVKTLVCEEKESDGHHHTDECYEKVLVCKKEVHTHSEKCYEEGDPGAPVDETSKAEGDEAKGDMTSKTEDAAADETAAASDEELISEPYVPELDPLNMEAVLDQHTDFYYFHAEKGEEVPADSSDISDWKQVEKDTDLASTDLVKLYLAYSIPAGSLNKTNPIARYRLPGNIHLTDEQIKAINKNENSFYAGLVNSDAADSAGQYLGAEAVEGDRTPDRLLQDDEQEYISAVVRAENVYEDDRYLGQDLIFTFIPYTIEKNQDTYDAEQNPVSAGEAVTGWFACDFQLDQIDWEEEENEIADAHTEDGTGGRVEKAVRKTADILFVEKNEEENIEEISRLLRLVEETAEEYQSGTLTADGDGYKVRLDYTEEAQIPEDAALSVREITPETDEEAYKSCLAQAREHVSGSGDEKSEVDTKASRFFDIEILVTEEDGTVRKIEPAAPVQVSIQIPEAAPETSVPGSESRGAQKADPRVLHFAEDGVEQVDSTTMTGDASSEDSNEGANKDTDADTGAGAGTDSEAETTSGNGEVTQVQFEAESFSVYGLVYTVDFHWVVNGKVFEFSLPGGGFVSFTDLVEVLGIVSGTNSAENAPYDAGEDAAEADGNDTEAVPLKLDDVAVSEETRKFVADVESLEFSNSELVWVGKIESGSTVGEVKEVNGLECQYSAELTEAQIAEINAQAVSAEDWALISLKPFSSKESLTVTMKDGEVFTILVTDISYDASTVNVNNLDGKTGALVRTRNNVVNAVQSTALNYNHLQAVAVTINQNTNTVSTEGDTQLTQWTFEKVAGTNNQYYISAPNGYLNIGAGSATVTSTRQALEVQTSGNQIRIKRTQDNYALNNDSNRTANGYYSWNGSNGYENDGEWFSVYAITIPPIGNSLDGQSLAIINNRNGGSSWQALRDEIDETKDSRGYYVSGNATSYTNVDGVDYSSSNDIFWTFEYVKSDDSGSYYRIHTSNGYLAIDPNVTKKSDMPTSGSNPYERALHLESEAGDGLKNDGTLIRIVPNGDGTYLLQNRNGVCLWNYGNNQFWLSTLEEENANEAANSRFRLTQKPEVPHVTVHYVDREGHILTGVKYTGSQTAVVDNHDGTFTIPYDVSGDVNLKTNFDFSTVGENQTRYTYANTHLAGKDASGAELTHNGLVIDAALTHSNGTLNFKSDSGETNDRYSHYNDWGWPDGDLLSPQGNLGYGNLQTNPLSGEYYRRPAEDSSLIKYVETGNKDIYVILDPLPDNVEEGGSQLPTLNPEDPELTKEMENNGDGTYTLSLTVDAHAASASETKKADILFVVDTSSSMRNVTTTGHNRISDTHDAVLDLGDRLLAYNVNHPGAVELSMITFDGSVDERTNPLWTTDADDFHDSVDYLTYTYLHTGTDWEDAMKEALRIVRAKKKVDDDPIFVVFFTDGEPSQYTDFSGKDTNTHNNPLYPSYSSIQKSETVSNGYSNFYSYFLSREASKDEMRAIVDENVRLYGIFAYNPTNEEYAATGENGADLLHNAIRYGYNTSADLLNKLFFNASDTAQLQNAFDAIFNSITETVGFSNVVVEDGIAAGVTSSTVIEGDVSGFTYIIRDNTGALAYKVTVAPNGVSKLPEGVTADDETPLFWFSETGPPVVGQKKTVSTTRIMKDVNGDPVLDDDGKFQTETADVEVYYYKDPDDPDAAEYIMPISTTGENISWDLSPLGLLKDGFSYEVNFIVWPNQESYDLVADLNNGKRPDIEATANWANCPIKTDSAGRQYRQGGFPGYPYISRYEDNGVYSAMSNTDQSVDYYKFDQKIVNGAEVTVITHNSDDVPPPGPMPLTASYSRIEKLWNYERNPVLFAQYLYNTDGSSKGFQVDFDVFQGTNLTTPYTGESLGWVYDLDDEGHYTYLGANETGDYVLEEGTGNKIKGHYVWAAGDTMSNVTYEGYPHQIGTRWTTDFAIATGLMLTAGEMNELGLNKSLYPSSVFEGETYYILEPGHDYTIKEHQVGTIGYEFDFIAPVYHPMLIDGVLRNVEIQYTYKQDPADPEKTVIDTATISSITGSQAGLSGLEIENTMRGYINLNKIVVDEDNNRVESDNTKFEYTILLESTMDPGPFEGDHIPWYGINGLFYNDGNENYYQVYESQDHVWMIRNEAGKEYVVTSTGFNPDEAGAQTVTYKVNPNDQEGKQITIYGNQMTATVDGKTATATLAITQNETLYIANVPVGTKYTITEANTEDYTLIDILKEVKNGTVVEKSEHVTNLSGRKAEGTIVTNRDNHVTYTNKVLTGALKITKEIRKNGTKDTSATGIFYYAVYDKPYDPNADPAMEPVRTGSINVTSGGTAEITEPDLKVGKYYVYELTGEGGTPVTNGGLYSAGKYYTVTVNGSPATVTLGNTSTAGIVNNYETAPVTATKSWADNNPQNLTVYFKLFYRNAAGVDMTTGTTMRTVAPGASSVTWNDMPKYDENGQLYNYIVREYILDDENGEYPEGTHKYTEAAPNGYVNTEAGLTVTNSKLETYDPVTTYSGIKLWVDTVNGSKTRPDGLTVTLMIDKEPFNNTAGDIPAVDKDGNTPQLAWVTIDEDEWKYTFHNLPMFDENKQIINYYAVETPVNGYTDSITGRINTKYELIESTLSTEFDPNDHDAYITMTSDADLVYTCVRKDHEGKLYHIWTQRPPTDTEKAAVVNLFNQSLRRTQYPAGATVDNVHWVSGLPINHEFVYQPSAQGGYKVSFTRYNTNTIRAKVDQHQKFDHICYGLLRYDYTAGSTDFKNELQPVSYEAEKTWGDGTPPPAGSVIVVQLQGTVQRPVNPQPADATETVYETVPVDLAAVGVTQKTQVTLNGGGDGGDDTAANPWKYTWSNLPQYNKEAEGDPLQITYSVREISYTIDGHTVNLMDFVPTEDTSTPGKTILTNQIPAFSFDILKIDEGSAKPLGGAKFTVQRIQPTSTVSDPVKVGDPISGDPLITGTDGKTTFNNIPLGYYEVEELQLPDGYILTGDGKFYIRVDTDSVKLLEKVTSSGTLSFREVEPAGSGGRIILGNVELTKAGNKFVLTVENTPGAALPNTGGPGTRLFTALGSILILGAGVLLWRRRRLI